MFGSRTGAEDHHVDAGKFRVIPHPLNQFHAVTFWHVHVGEDHFDRPATVAGPLHRLDGRVDAVNDRWLHAPVSGDFFENQAVCFVVVNNEHRHVLQEMRIHTSPGRFISEVELGSKTESRADIRFTLNSDLATHQFDELFGDCQAQPSATVLASR